MSLISVEVMHVDVIPVPAAVSLLCKQLAEMLGLEASSA